MLLYYFTLQLYFTFLHQTLLYWIVTILTFIVC